MLEPIVSTIQVPCGQEKAFRVFVDDMNRWWPINKFSAAKKDGLATSSLLMDASVGGKIIETAENDSEYIWGTVKSYDPYDSFSMDWHPGKPPEAASLVELKFISLSDNQTRVELTQSNWENVAKDDSGKFRPHFGKGWVLIFERAYKSACGG